MVLRMSRSRIAQTLLPARDVIITVGPVMVLALVLLAIAYWVLDPTPPKHVVMATGAERGAYAEYGKRYRALLAPYGIDVELRNTQGAAENLRLLRDPASGVEVAFLQGGAGEELKPPPQPVNDGLESLGTLFYEPLWVFYRVDTAQRLLGSDVLPSLARLSGWRVNIGAPGSGAANLFLKMLDASDIGLAAMRVERRPQKAAVAALISGETDVIVLTSAPDSSMIQGLLRTPGLKLLDFPDAEAWSRRLPVLSPLTLPRGIIDLAGDLPPADMHMVAPTATLGARGSLHPVLAELFAQAATEVHHEPGWFQRKGDFPGTTDTERPMADEAARFYRNGPQTLQHYLPFWLVNLVDRMWVAMVSIVAILIPLSRVVPPLYQFRIRSRIFRWYAQLRAVEQAQGSRPSKELARELDQLESRVGAIAVPLSYTDQLYALRGHIALVRRHLAESDFSPTLPA
jgi:hypothetical protein